MNCTKLTNRKKTNYKPSQRWLGFYNIQSLQHTSYYNYFKCVLKNNNHLTNTDKTETINLLNTSIF